MRNVNGRNNRCRFLHVLETRQHRRVRHHTPVTCFLQPESSAACKQVFSLKRSGKIVCASPTPVTRFQYTILQSENRSDILRCLCVKERYLVCMVQRFLANWDESHEDRLGLNNWYPLRLNNWQHSLRTCVALCRPASECSSGPKL